MSDTPEPFLDWCRKHVKVLGEDGREAAFKPNPLQMRLIEAIERGEFPFASGSPDLPPATPEECVSIH